MEVPQFNPSLTFCKSCTAVLTAEMEQRVLLHPSFESLRLSKKDCALCQTIYQSIPGPESCYCCNFAEWIDDAATQIWAHRGIIDVAWYKVPEVGARWLSQLMTTVKQGQVDEPSIWDEMRIVPSRLLGDAVWGTRTITSQMIGTHQHCILLEEFETLKRKEPTEKTRDAVRQDGDGKSLSDAVEGPRKLKNVLLNDPRFWAAMLNEVDNFRMEDSDKFELFEGIDNNVKLEDLSLHGPIILSQYKGDDGARFHRFALHAFSLPGKFIFSEQYRYSA